MVVAEPEMVSPGDEVVDSTQLQVDLRRRHQQQEEDDDEDELLHDKDDDHNISNHRYHHNHPFSSLGRQSSIYSLTLDEFQHALSESGKNFGSMNMDEFLASIWTAEENQHHGHPPAPAAANAAASASNGGNTKAAGLGYDALVEHHPKGGHLVQQSSLPRQGSLSLPAPLCRKTVDEVWSEIHRSGGQVHHGSGNGGGGGNAGGPGAAAGRQPTFGEMTLEDFLVKAGVVQENQCGVPAPPLQQYGGVYQGGSGNGNGSASLGGGFGLGAIRGGGGVGYAPARVYGGGVGNDGGGGYVAGGGMMGPVSPVASSDGMVGGVDGGHYGMDMGGLRGRKRIIDGPVEKVVERRQRRMIKNRESAARSRARKQAYTVELEAELNQLKEENRQLKQALADMERKRKQQYMEESRMKNQTKAQKARERLSMMRRNTSCPL